MLWKKESRKSDALYVNMFGSNEHDWDMELQLKLLTIQRQPNLKKSNTIALRKRNEGNEEFRNGALVVAIELYNDSLRYAKPQSQHISLAYANRATCFLKLKMYVNCLMDIELAKQAGYPEHLMAKLDDRHVKCLLEMQNDQQQQQPEALSIESDDPRFPCLANVVKVQRSETGVFSVVAKADIDVGQTICIEQPFSAYLFDRFGGRCKICTKDSVNLMPCAKCAFAMFCPDCQGHVLHEYECGLNGSVKGGNIGLTLSSIRDILLIVELFPNVDELMAFVEEMLRMKPNELPESLSDDRQKFQVLFNSALPSKYGTDDDIKYAVHMQYKMIMLMPKIKGMFASTKHRRFLMHLIGHLLSVSSCRSIFTDMFFPDCINPMAVFKTVMRKYFQHSCNPNVLYVNRDGKLVVFAVKPIKAGEELFISYDQSGLKNTRQERQETLWKEMMMKCSCSRCKGRAASPAQRQQLVSDPAYRFFQANEHYFKRIYSMNIEKGRSVMEQCFVILRKHGRMDGWCDELGSVITFFYYFQYLCAPDDVQRPLAQALFANIS